MRHEQHEEHGSHGPPVPVIFTIGHSNHGLEHFLELLEAYEIETLVDVRSRPFSRFNPHFNQQPLRAAVESLGILYLHLGGMLGGKPDDPAMRDGNGDVSFGLIAASEPFRAALEIVVQEAGIGRTVIMCAEDDPRGCHRYHLITPHLVERGLTVLHIRGDGRLETREDLARGQMGLDV